MKSLLLFFILFSIEVFSQNIPSKLKCEGICTDHFQICFSDNLNGNLTACKIVLSSCNDACNTWYAINHSQEPILRLNSWKSICRVNCDDTYRTCNAALTKHGLMDECYLNWKACDKFCTQSIQNAHDSIDNNGL